VQAVREFQRTLSKFKTSIQARQSEIGNELRLATETLSEPDAIKDACLQKCVHGLARGTAEDEISKLANAFIQSLVDVTQEIENKTHRLVSQLGVAAANFAGEANDVQAEFDEGLTSHCQRFLIGEVASRVPELVQELDEQLLSFIQRAGGLWPLFTDESNQGQAALHEAIVNTSRYLIRNELGNIDVDDLIRAQRIDEHELVDWIRPSVEDATPHIMDCGGQARLMISVPRMSAGQLCSDAVEAIFDETPTVVPATSGSVSLCIEVQQIPVANVALRLLEDAPDAGECVGRLTSRTDVDWEPLTGIA
jgi:hypothetical protein